MGLVGGFLCVCALLIWGVFVCLFDLAGIHSCPDPMISGIPPDTLLPQGTSHLENHQHFFTFPSDYRHII